MKDKPILFNADMIRALLDGRKTQTRRIVKPQPIWIGEPGVPFKTTNADPKGIINCPYGYRGRLAWVRETTEADETTNDTCVLSRYSADGKPVLYSGSDDPEYDGSIAHWDYHQSTRPSIHMHRWASRLTLKIIDIRIERVQDISDGDAKAEGCKGWELRAYCHDHDVGIMVYETSCEQFKVLWNSINTKRGFGWDKNPWVWCVSFSVIHKNIDDVLQEMERYIMNPWLPWPGGECPVPIGTLVDVKHRNGDIFYKAPADVDDGDAETWFHDYMLGTDIITYRIHEERK